MIKIQERVLEVMSLKEKIWMTKKKMVKIGSSSIPLQFKKARTTEMMTNQIEILQHSQISTL